MAKTSESTGLLEESVPPDFCSGLALDLSESMAESHAAVFVIALAASGNLKTPEEAKADSVEWRTNVWVCRLCFLYYPAVAALSSIPVLGRAMLRTLACGSRSWADPVRNDESARELEVRTVWIVPCVGWFIVVIFLSCIQCAYIWFGGEVGLKRSNFGLYTGAITRGIIAVSFIAGSVTLLHAMRRRDALLLRTCALGNAAFALSMVVMLIVAVVALPREESDINFGVTLVFSVLLTIAFVYYGALCFTLWRDYTEEEEARRKPGLEDTPGAWLWWFEQGIALLIVALICILVTALNVVSVVSDPEGYWNNIGR